MSITNPIVSWSLMAVSALLTLSVIGAAIIYGLGSPEFNNLKGGVDVPSIALAAITVYFLAKLDREAFKARPIFRAFTVITALLMIVYFI